MTNHGKKIREENKICDIAMTSCLILKKCWLGQERGDEGIEKGHGYVSSDLCIFHIISYHEKLM